MVEGPGCKINGEQMRKKVSGKVIVDVKLRCSKKAGKEPEFRALCGFTVTGVRTIGKELFIFLAQSPICVRIHFLMDGSVRYGETNHGKNEKSDPTIEIVFTNEKLTIFKSSVELRPTAESIEHCDFLADLDICSPVFNFKRAQTKIEEKTSELICDVIMDQSILPGVGNIIKNEGLFKSGINPNTLVEDLSSNLIACLVHRLRDFTAIFYMCRKNNKPLKNHLSIYEKSVCSQCGKQVTICKPGTLGRLTFFCSNCQINSNSSADMSLPKKNSLLGFLKLSAEPRMGMQRWECPHCTFINSKPSRTCEMCFSIAETKKRKLSDVDPQPGIPTKVAKSEAQSSNFSSNETSANNATKLCATHRKPCSTRTVIRSGENKGRLFYCCSLRGNKQCKFFEWADLHHPMCEHNKRTIVRRVLKQNCNNGKEFYCCPLSKSEQCSFFQWVEK